MGVLHVMLTRFLKPINVVHVPSMSSFSLKQMVSENAKNVRKMRSQKEIRDSTKDPRECKDCPVNNVSTENGCIQCPDDQGSDFLFQKNFQIFKWDFSFDVRPNKNL